MSELYLLKGAHLLYVDVVHVYCFGPLLSTKDRYMLRIITYSQDGFIAIMV